MVAFLKLSVTIICEDGHQPIFKRFAGKQSSLNFVYSQALYGSVNFFVVIQEKMIGGIVAIVF